MSTDLCRCFDGRCEGLRSPGMVCRKSAVEPMIVDGWITHDGGPRPVDPDTMVEIPSDAGNFRGLSGGFDWKGIRQYRVVGERRCHPRPGEPVMLQPGEECAPPPRKHSHYFKSVAGLDTIDVYRVLQLFAVTDPCIGHAVKKLLVAGGRGAGKDITVDIQEAIDTLVRWQEMQREVA